MHQFLSSKAWYSIRRWVYCYSSPFSMLLKSRKTLKKYKDKYKGQRCFIIGNGPSLTGEDLNLLCGEICFASNRIYEIYGQTRWRPTFYCIQDNRVADMVVPKAELAIMSVQQTFFRALTYKMKKDKYEKYSDHIVVVPILSQSQEATDDLSKRKFSSKADHYIYDGDTVTYMLIELAAYMGFTKLYLLGVDGTFPRVEDKNGNLIENDKSKRAHFYETVEDNDSELIQSMVMPRDIQFAAYQAAENYSRRTGKFRIYNATRGGELEIFERVSFDEIMKQTMV